MCSYRQQFRIRAGLLGTTHPRGPLSAPPSFSPSAKHSGDVSSLGLIACRPALHSTELPPNPPGRPRQGKLPHRFRIIMVISERAADVSRETPTASREQRVLTSASPC